MSDQIGETDLIFYSMGENVYSGGFAIDSALMREGLSAMKTIKSQEGGSTFEGIFGKNYAVPPMWFLSPYDSTLQTGGSRENLNNLDSEIIEEDLHDKLLNILEGTRKEKKKTAKLREKRKRSTKRNAN